MRAILSAAIVLAATVTQAADLHVAPDGDDANTGTAEKPFATLNRARDAIRELRDTRAATGRCRVIVADGAYTLTEPFVLTPEDGGTETAPVLYQAAPGPGRSSAAVGFSKAGTKARTASGRPTCRRSPRGTGTSSSSGSMADAPRRARTPNQFTFYMQDVDQEVLERRRQRAQADAGAADRPHAAGGLSAGLRRPRRRGPEGRQSPRLPQVGQHPAVPRRDRSRPEHDRHERRGDEVVEPVEPQRTVPPGELPRGPGRPRRVVPGPRRHDLLQAATGRGHDEGGRRRAGGREVRRDPGRSGVGRVRRTRDASRG